MPTGERNGRDPNNGADFLARGTGNQQINEWNSQYNVLMNAMEKHNGGNGVTNAQNGGGVSALSNAIVRKAPRREVSTRATHGSSEGREFQEVGTAHAKALGQDRAWNAGGAAGRPAWSIVKDRKEVERAGKGWCELSRALWARGGLGVLPQGGGSPGG